MAANAEAAVNAALSQLGKPYKWGTPLNPFTKDPKSFDCSGLTMWAYHRAGSHIFDATHSANLQYGLLAHIPVSQAQPGDLIFYGHNSRLPAYHVAMVTQSGQVVEAPEKGVPVRTRGWAPGDTDLLPKAGKFPGVRNTAPPGWVQVQTPKPGGWRTYLGKPLRDPPAGTYILPLEKPYTDRTNPSGWRVSNFPDTKDAAVWQWMLDYHDDGSLAQRWGNNHPDHPSLINEYGALLGAPPMKSFNEISSPDPGPAEAGIGPAPSWDDIIGSIMALIKNLLDPHFWLRMLEIGLGVILVGLGIAHATGVDNSVSKFAKGFM